MVQNDVTKKKNAAQVSTADSCQELLKNKNRLCWKMRVG